MTTQNIIQNVITARAKEIVNYVEMGMDLEWAIDMVKSSTTLGPQSMEQVIEIVNAKLSEVTE
jgi:hypothetical protein